MNKFLRRTVLAALLAACGGSGSDDSAPDTIQDMAKDDTVQFDYGDYLGIWSNGTGDYDSFEVEPGESGEVRWLLYAGANWEYSGYLQYVEEYGYVYAYNDHNGTAYRCELDGAELTVAEIGTFTYGGSGTPDDFRQTSLYWPATGIRTAMWTATAAWRSLRTASGPCWIAPATWTP